MAEVITENLNAVAELRESLDTEEAINKAQQFKDSLIELNMAELIVITELLLASFIINQDEWFTKGNKAAGRRARSLSILINYLFKEFRVRSIKYFSN